MAIDTAPAHPAPQGTVIYYWTSGLLIGGDVRIGLASGERRVVVMGRPELTRLYAEAIRLAGAEPVELDGEKSFLSGILEIARRMQ